MKYLYIITLLIAGLVWEFASAGDMLGSENCPKNTSGNSTYARNGNSNPDKTIIPGATEIKTEEALP